ncbi:uncharacterized protein [Miscanthus floridulus]|uniref:uncharacterized protein n=1 Tax=Miscanthus floridulus TaxID=154761 RepID=UPI00345A8ECF
MESQCMNHPYPVKHLYKDYELLKRFLRQAARPKEGKGKEEAKKRGAVGKDEDGFSDLEECLMIFGGSDAIHSKRQHKRDHPSHIAQPSHYPLVVDPIIRKKCLTNIDLPVMFGHRANFRLEVLTFEVVDFLGSYHTFLGWPCYAKFMAISNYTYLKLKMQRPNDIITIGSTFSHAYTCDCEHYELATTVINSVELPEVGNLATPVVPDCNGPTFSSAFHPTEETKAVEIDPTDPTKMVRMRTKLLAK